MKTATMLKYVPFGAPYSVYALEYNGKHLTDVVHTSDRAGLGRLIEYALNCGFDQIKFIDYTKQ